MSLGSGKSTCQMDPRSRDRHLTDGPRNGRPDVGEESVFGDCFDGAETSQAFLAAKTAVSTGLDPAEWHGLVEIEHAKATRSAGRPAENEVPTR